MELVGKSNKKRKKIKHWIPFYIMGLPGMIYLLINNYLPMVGLQVAFKKWDYQKGMWFSDWIGLKNFEFLFKSQAFRITRNTLLYNLTFIIVGAILGISVAILVNEIQSKQFKKIYQTIILLPFLMSMVIVAYLTYAYLSPQTGYINNILEAIGLNRISWYSEKKYWPFILVFVQQWKTIGFGMVIYLSSIVGISKDYYEAAELDGATKWQQIRTITLPLLKPTIITLLILQVGQIFRSDFGLFYQVPMDQGSLYAVTDTIDTFVYRGLMKTNNIGMSAAAGFYQSVVCFITVVIFNGVIRKVNKENAMF
jgi:putative aldouronate transport system permease protein